MAQGGATSTNMEGRTGVEEGVLGGEEDSRAHLGEVGTTHPRREDRGDQGVLVMTWEHPITPRIPQLHHHAHSTGGEEEQGNRGTRIPTLI